MSTIPRCLVTLAFYCLATASPAQDSPQALQDAFMQALRGNDAAGLAACYAGDAVNFPVGALVEHGPEAVQASWEGFFSGMTVRQARLEQAHLEVHGDTAVAWGLFVIVADPKEGGAPIELRGRYMDVARHIDGRWLYVADHASMPPSPAPDTEPRRDADELALRRAADEFYRAYFEGDWDRYYGFYSSDATFIDHEGRLLTLEEYRQFGEDAVAGLGELQPDGLDDLKMSLRMNAAGDAAVGQWRHPFIYEKPGGERTTVVFAETDVWWKTGDAWKVTHVQYDIVKP